MVSPASAFTLSGGGANCQGSGVITSTGGVPSGVLYSFYYLQTAYLSYQGTGNGGATAGGCNYIRIQ
jgi:hypothetical protein